jgi:arylsulfatase
MTLKPLSSAQKRSALLSGVAALFLASCGQESYQGPYKHVLLISLDTTRADALGCLGGGEGASPRIDALASQAVKFSETTCTAPTTLASHTSIMTGLHPRRHGVPRNGFMVAQENVLLAEVLDRAGFHTAGFLGSYALDRAFDFNQGFEAWDQDFDIEYSPLDADQNQRRAERVTDAVLSHVDEVGDSERLFLFAHYFDAHAPYDPPSPFAERFALPGGPTSSNLRDVARQELAHQARNAGDRRVVFSEGLTRELIAGSSGEPLPGDTALAALYAGEVAYMDAHIGRLLDGLEERGILKDCVVVLTADHGETFWEHADAWHHGAWVYQTNVHVPLLFRLPDGRGAGSTIEAPVSTVDIFPTLLELLELPLPEPVDGVSLLGALDGAPLAERALFTEATQPVNELEAGSPWPNQAKPRAVRRGRWKLVEAPYLELTQLFDLETDPGEQVDLIAAPTPQSRVEAPLLQRELDLWSRDPRPRGVRFNSTQVDEVHERLQALGYTGEALPPEDL